MSTSDKRFVWCGAELCEERDGSNPTTVNRRFFGFGVVEGAAPYYYGEGQPPVANGTAQGRALNPRLEIHVLEVNGQATAPAPGGGEVAPAPPAWRACLRRVLVGRTPITTGARTEDQDLDGLPDVLDRCPARPETANGVRDSDGCPD